VHFAAIGHPVLGDSVYGEASPLIARQALHAKTISFIYKDVRYDYDYPVPPDMARLIETVTI
jgi:23S rRNA pseudouridine1911/1915/1917 synthase